MTAISFPVNGHMTEGVHVFSSSLHQPELESVAENITLPTFGPMRTAWRTAGGERGGTGVHIQQSWVSLWCKAQLQRLHEDLRAPNLLEKRGGGSNIVSKIFTFVIWNVWGAWNIFRSFKHPSKWFCHAPVWKYYMFEKCPVLISVFCRVLKWKYSYQSEKKWYWCIPHTGPFLTWLY